ncbi:EF-hand domain-containing protein [Streptomyces sp. NPDC048338]|uniref:EF-hand domain-containing protein n=1 Tax=Streptomyces sp. NPDC048338 TaxID=3365536 RepID=UPI00371F7A93
MAGPDPISRRLRRLFAVLDGDGDGSVTWADHRGIVDRYAAGYGLASDDARIQALERAYWELWLGLLARAEPGRDRLSEEEFVAAHRSADYETDGQNVLERLARAIFRILDTDGDQRVGADEFAAYLTVWGVSGDAGPVAFRRLDLDRDAFISQREIARSLRAFHINNDDLDTPGGLFLGVR